MRNTSRCLVPVFKGVFLAALILGCLTVPAQAGLWDGFELIPRVSAATGYDDNINTDKDNKIDDVFTEVSAELDARSQSHTRQVDLIARLTQQVFWNESDYNNLSQDYQVAVKQDLSRYDRLNVNDRFSRSEDPETFEDAFGRTAGRFAYYQNIFSAEYARDFSKRLSVNVKYDNEYYDPQRSGSSKSFLNQGTLQTDYYFTSSTVGVFSYVFADRSFDPGDHAVTHAFLAGVRHYFNAQMFVDARSGVNVIKAFNDESLTKPKFSVSLTNDVDETTRLNLSFIKDYSTNNDTADVFDSWRVSFSAGHQLSERLSGFATTFYGEGEYDASAIKDELRGMTLGLSYELSRDSRVTLSYTYSQTESNFDSRDYVRNRVLMGWRKEF